MLKNYFYMAGKQRFCDEITWLDVLMQHLRHNRINPSELRWLIFIYIQYREMMIQKSHPSSFLISKKFKIVLVKRVYKICNSVWVWILDVMLIALVSNVTLLEWLSNFAQYWLPCARLNPVARIPWAPSSAQIFKVTVIEWLLKLTLLALHQVFTPYVR